MDNAEKQAKIDSLTKIVARLSKATPITEALSDMKIVTTMGILRSALRAYVTADTRKYNAAPERFKRGAQPHSNSNNAYPAELKAKVLAEFDMDHEVTRTTHNFAEVARKYGINRITVKRWFDAHKGA